jgi:hypothetical protein
MNGLRTRGGVAVLAIAATLLGLVPAQAAKPREVPLADYSIAFGEIADLWWPSSGTGFPSGWSPDLGSTMPPPGTWSVSDIRFVDDRYVDLHVVVEPPAPSLVDATNAGPAVLFTTLGLYGGFGGDVGFQRFVSIQHVGLPACVGDPCRFESDVRVDVHRLPRIARSVPRLRASTAIIGFVLLRTFAGGTWLQRVVAGDVVDRPGWSGTLSRPEDWVGQAPPMGLFPRAGARDTAQGPGGGRVGYLGIVDAVRDAMGDTSVPVSSTDVRVIATFTGCDEAVTATLHSDDGDDVLPAPARRQDQFDATVSLPVGSTWWVRWADDPSPAFTVTDQPLLVAASLACDELVGRTVTDTTVAEVVDRWPPSERR